MRTTETVFEVTEVLKVEYDVLALGHDIFTQGSDRDATLGETL